MTPVSRAQRRVLECKHQRRLSIVDGTGLGIFYSLKGDKSRRPESCRQWDNVVRHVHWCCDCGRLRIGNEKTWRTHAAGRTALEKSQ